MLLALSWSCLVNAILSSKEADKLYPGAIRQTSSAGKRVSLYSCSCWRKITGINCLGISEEQTWPATSAESWCKWVKNRGEDSCIVKVPLMGRGGKFRSWREFSHFCVMGALFLLSWGWSRFSAHGANAPRQPQLFAQVGTRRGLGVQGEQDLLTQWAEM